MRFLIVPLLLLQGCVTIGANERQLKEARLDELYRAQRWCIKVQTGEWKAVDMQTMVIERIKKWETK